MSRIIAISSFLSHDDHSQLSNRHVILYISRFLNRAYSINFILIPFTRFLPFIELTTIDNCFTSEGRIPSTYIHSRPRRFLKVCEKTTTTMQGSDKRAHAYLGNPAATAVRRRRRFATSAFPRRGWFSVRALRFSAAWQSAWHSPPRRRFTCTNDDFGEEVSRDTRGTPPVAADGRRRSRGRWCGKCGCDGDESRVEKGLISPLARRYRRETLVKSDHKGPSGRLSLAVLSRGAASPTPVARGQ